MGKAGGPAGHDDPSGFGFRLFRLGQHWRRELNTSMHNFGLTDATWRPLFHLGRVGDGSRQTDLAAVLGIEGPSLVRLLDALEGAGLIERRNGPEDRRSKTLHITKSGRDLFEKVSREHAQVSAELLRNVSASDLAVCERVFAVIELNLADTASS